MNWPSALLNHLHDGRRCAALAGAWRGLWSPHWDWQQMPGQTPVHTARLLPTAPGSPGCAVKEPASILISTHVTVARVTTTAQVVSTGSAFLGAAFTTTDPCEPRTQKEHERQTRMKGRL